jgi:hypothetical protein
LKRLKDGGGNDFGVKFHQDDGMGMADDLFQ